MAHIPNHKITYTDERYQKMVELAQEISGVPLGSMGGFRAEPGKLFVTQIIRSVAHSSSGMPIIDLQGNKILVSSELEFKIGHE